MVESGSKRGEIGPGDLIRAIKKLPRLNEQDLQKVARSLGFMLDVSMAEKTVAGQGMRGAWNRPRHRGRQSPAARQPVFSQKPTMPSTREVPPEVPETILTSELEVLDPVDPGISEVPVTIERLRPLQTESPEPVSRKSLFTNNTARGLLVPAVAQPTPGFEPEIPVIIECFVRCQFLDSLPTRIRYTSRNGCHLLLDFSEQLTPWWPDLRDLIDQIHCVLGAELCPVYEFEGDPADAVCWSGEKEVAWKPVAGIPVLIASDLGTLLSRVTGYRPGLDIWRRFARNCASRQVPVIALVPLDPSRWPKALNRVIKLIHWNPATDAASVQRLLREFG